MKFLSPLVKHFATHHVILIMEDAQPVKHVHYSRFSVLGHHVHLLSSVAQVRFLFYKCFIIIYPFIKGALSRVKCSQHAVQHVPQHAVNQDQYYVLFNVWLVVSVHLVLCWMRGTGNVSGQSNVVSTHAINMHWFICYLVSPDPTNYVASKNIIQSTSDNVHTQTHTGACHTRALIKPSKTSDAHKRTHVHTHTHTGIHIYTLTHTANVHKHNDTHKHTQ